MPRLRGTGPSIFGEARTAPFRAGKGEKMKTIRMIGLMAAPALLVACNAAGDGNGEPAGAAAGKARSPRPKSDPPRRHGAKASSRSARPSSKRATTAGRQPIISTASTPMTCPIPCCSSRRLPPRRSSEAARKPRSTISSAREVHRGQGLRRLRPIPMFAGRTTCTVVDDARAHGGRHGAMCYLHPAPDGNETKVEYTFGYVKDDARAASRSPSTIPPLPFSGG